MSQKAKLFQKITLENLMLHEYTQVNLDKESITLITGANGSGKTQILDGLIICLGHIPSRAKAKGIGSFVGKHGETSVVTLEVANPVMNGKRAIWTMDKDLNSVIDFDSFKIGAKISKQDSSITYTINDSRKVIRGRLVTRGDIRRLFETVGVRGENKLAFTGEGTVDEFASKSPKRKLDVLLEVTGLKQYREEVINAQEILKNSIQEIEPLKRKFETESKLLSLWNDAMKILNQKKKLMLMKTKLETELIWSHVVRLEKQIESVNQQRLKILKQKSDNDKAIEDKESEIELTSKRLKVLNDELQLIEEQEKIKNRTLITIETQLSYEDDNIRNFKREIERYGEQKEKMEKILESKDLSAKDRQLQDRQEALIIKTKKLSMIQEKFAKGENELLSLRKKIVSEPDYDTFNADEDIFSGEHLTRYEEDLVTSAKIFTQKIRKQGLEKEIIGPIISDIRMKEGENSWEKAVKNLIGSNLYAFAAKTDESYRFAKRLYDETWPRWKPPLTVFRVTTDDAKTALEEIKKPPYSEIYNIATNLIDGNPFIIGLLKRVVKGSVADDKYDPTVLTQIAKDSKINVLTKSGNSFYLYHGGFGRPPAPMKNPLGWQIKTSEDKPIFEVGNEREIRLSIARLERDTRELKIDEIKTLQEISRLHQEIQTLGMPDEKILGKIETINEIISVIDAKIKECKIHQNELKLKLDEASDDFGTYAIKRAEIKKRSDEIEETEELLKLELHSLREKSSRLLTIEINLDAEYNTFYDDKKEKVELAEQKGERPEEIRTHVEIRDELSRIEGHLESIGISNVDEDKIEAQKAKVDSLQTYMKEREEHITNLRADLEARLAFWNGELQEIITNITRSMKLLLGGIFEKIKLKVTNITNPDEAGLFIEAITKGKAYRDFRELSGGEKVLAIEGLILAMHTLTDSPIHAIDEFTQRLDDKNKALAFSIAIRTQKLASENSRFIPQFILLCPDALNVEITKDINHLVVSELKVVKAEAVR
ncbi:MAG: AAA family ATPase [Candidatus Heimdallarchaeota archaeon]|nr:AAA family ATPase [Candidatus Heimdallarchaeota archaeon]